MATSQTSAQPRGVPQPIWARMSKPRLNPVVIHGAPRCVIAVPDVETLPLGFGIRLRQGLLEHVTGKIAFIHHKIDGIVHIWWCLAHLLQVVLGGLERLAQGRRITLIGFVNFGGNHRIAVQSHRMFRLTG